MNNRLHNGKVVICTTFYQFSLHVLMNLGFPVMPDHCTRDKKVFVEQIITFSLILLCNRVVSAVPQLLCGPVLVSLPWVLGGHRKSFLVTSSEKPCSWACSWQLFLSLYPGPVVLVTFFYWLLDSDMPTVLPCSERMLSVGFLWWHGGPMATGCDIINARWWILSGTHQREQLCCAMENPYSRTTLLYHHRKQRKWQAKFSLLCFFCWADPSPGHLQLQCESINMNFQSAKVLYGELLTRLVLPFLSVFYYADLL